MPSEDKRYSVRVSESERNNVKRLTQQAGFTSSSEFLRKLVEHIGKTEAPFDVRDIVVHPKK